MKLMSFYLKCIHIYKSTPLFDIRAMDTYGYSENIHTDDGDCYRCRFL